MRVSLWPSRGFVSIPCVSALLLALTVAPPALAQEPEAAEEMSAEEAAMMEAWQASMKIGPQHEHLAEMVGEYDMKVTFWQDPEGEPEVMTGSASRSMKMEGRVLEERVESEVMGEPFYGEARIGYDNVTGRYWTTWVDNMSTGLHWAFGGQEEDGTMVMLGKAPNPMSGGYVEQKTVITGNHDGTEHHVMYEKRGDEWVKAMEIVYTPK